MDRQVKAVVVAVLVLSGCAPTVMQVALAPADVQLAQGALGAGSGTIKGSALLRQRGGGVVTCAGGEVALIPATASASQELQRIFGGERGYVARSGGGSMGDTYVAPPEPHRLTTCNPQGFFTFDNVRAGRWHIMAAVVWAVGASVEGGTLFTTTEVSDGGSVEVVLTY